jgi:hypothetical protein
MSSHRQKKLLINLVTGENYGKRKDSQTENQRFGFGLG